MEIRSTQLFSTLIILIHAVVVSCAYKKTPDCFERVIYSNYNDNSNTLYFYVMNDLDKGIECAKSSKKYLLIIFSANKYSSVWDVEWRAISFPKLNTLINENFVTIFLPTDDSTSLSDTTLKSIYTERTINTKGEKNLDIQIKLANTETSPLFVIADTSLKIINKGFFYIGEKYNVPMFNFLESSINKKHN
jgi:hypothetical protein